MQRLPWSGAKADVSSAPASQPRCGFFEKAALSLTLMLAGCASVSTADAQINPLPTFHGACLTATPLPKDLVASPRYAQYKVVVKASSGSLIDNLEQSNFGATLSGKAIPIVFFSHAARAPVSLVILVDTSASMRSQLEWVRPAIDEIIQQLCARDKLALIAFSTSAYVLQPLTTDHELVRKRLNILHPFGATAALDAEAKAIAILEHADYPTRALLVITDGMDNASSPSEDDILHQLKAAQIALYAIGIGNPGPGTGPTFTSGPFPSSGIADLHHVDASALQEMADQSGGQAYIVQSGESFSSDFINVIADIAQAIGRRYSIGVLLPSPLKPDSTVRISVNGRPDAIVSVARIDARQL
jgi:VWFA-related protein